MGSQLNEKVLYSSIIEDLVLFIENCYGLEEILDDERGLGSR